MLTLNTLSTELLVEIFKVVHDSSRHSIFSLLRVSKPISEAALPFVYRELTFDFDQSRARASHRDGQADVEPYTQSIEKLKSLLHLPPESPIWRNVREVRVSSKFARWPGEDTGARRIPQRDSDAELPFAPSEEAVRDKWGCFIQFLSRIINLQQVIFDCAERVPIILLEVLEANHPFCRLHVRNWTHLRADVRVGDPYEEALARSPCLRSLQAHFFYRGPGMDFSYVAFQRILALAPNLEDIAYSSRSAGGCILYTIDEEQNAKAKKERERFHVAQPVRKTHIERINWDSLHLALLQHWESFMVLQKVKRLELGGIDDMEWMEHAMDHGTFSGLKHLSFKVNHYPRGTSQVKLKSTLERFVSSQPPLESLSFIQYHGYIDLFLIFLHHGASLRSLSLHQIESTQGTRPLLSLDNLNLIRSEIPHLEHLELDLNRTRNPQENEMQTYAILSSFPSLRTIIVIYYDLGIHNEYFSYPSAFCMAMRDPEQVDALLKDPEHWQPRVPPEFMEYQETYTTLDEHFVRKVWQAVYNRRLEELVLYVGEPNREMGMGYPALWATREQELRKRVRARRNERDDLREDVSALEISEGLEDYKS
ncbi:hypothetical protein PM082_021626 [Marasmius tenuissimus]|nr:hypothetical protein PM082_021626 [Marasmius tenuissimus]